MANLYRRSICVNLEVVEDLTSSLVGSIRLNKPEDASLKSIQRKRRYCVFFWLGAGERDFLPSAGCCFYSSAKRRVRQVHGDEISLFGCASEEGHNVLLFRVVQPHDGTVSQCRRIFAQFNKSVEEEGYVGEEGRIRPVHITLSNSCDPPDCVASPTSMPLYRSGTPGSVKVRLAAAPLHVVHRDRR